MSLIMTTEMIANMAKEHGVSGFEMLRMLKDYDAEDFEPHNRALFIGSSDCAAILGVSPWSTAYDVYLRKTPGYVPEELEPEKAKVLRRGTRMEPYILQCVAEELDLEIVARGKRYIDRDDSFICAEIDAEFIDEDGTVQNMEIKTASQYTAKNWDDVPTYYQAQAMHGLMVTGRQRVLFVVLIGSDDLRTFWLERDEEIIQYIREMENEFWYNNVIAKVAPEPKTAADVMKMFTKVVPGGVEASFEVLQAVTKLKDLKAQEKNLKKAKEEVENEVKLAIGAYEALTFQGKVLATWKSSPANHFDTTALKEANPEIYEQFYTKSMTRKFLVK